MYIFRENEPLGAYVHECHNSGQSVGFVPTMGALHQGHLSLVERSQQGSDITVVSIFVNPTQFNDPGDLKKYPRPLEADLELLYEHKVDVAYVPSVEQVYPAGLNTEVDFDFNGLDAVMEGEFRPGHFKGMAQVVNRLLTLVDPDHLYMGQKDFQQAAIVQQMISELNLRVELVVCPTLREQDGLAMSSRNVLLLPAHREKAGIIYHTLQYARDHFGQMPTEVLENDCLDRLKLDGFKPEYFSIVDGRTLLPIDDGAAGQVVACCAVFAGSVRLIDNMILREAR